MSRQLLFMIISLFLFILIIRQKKEMNYEIYYGKKEMYNYIKLCRH